METSTNTSSSQNVSLPPRDPSLNSSLNSSPSSCFISPPGSSIFAAATITNILLLLPLSIFILLFGFQQLRKQRSNMTVNPADIFTYHMVTMELIGICGSVFCCCGAFIRHQKMAGVGCNLFAIISCIKMFFHALTCVERYLAVVHPITYLSLTKMGGVMIRNVSTACVWFVCSGLMTIRFVTSRNFNLILFFCSLLSSLIIISFCSLSVLRVLLRPGPGDGGENKLKVNTSKQRAFITITSIMAVLLFRFFGNLVCQALAFSHVLNPSDHCIAQVSGIWFCLPSSYVLPLLFLHRAGKLLCFKHSAKSG